MANLYEFCSCPLCSQKYDSDDNLTNGSVIECFVCHAVLNVEVVGGYSMLNLIRGYHSLVDDKVVPVKCKDCLEKNTHMRITIKDSIGIEYDTYPCKLDISFSPNDVPGLTYRYYCDKQEEKVLARNVTQSLAIEEIEDFGLQIISRNLKQTETILGMITWYTQANMVQVIVNDDIESRFDSFYVKHKAIIHIKFAEKGIVVDIHSDEYSWKHCITYYILCKLWDKTIINIFDIILDKDTFKNVSAFNKQKSKDVPGVSDTDVYLLFDHLSDGN